MRKTIKYIVGNPGSGKTFGREKYKEELGDAFVLDYNDYKDYSLLSKGYSQKEVHELSVQLGRKIFMKHLMADENLIFECTLTNLLSKELQTSLKRIKNRGYYAELYIVNTPINEAMARNASREFPTPLDHFIEIEDIGHTEFIKALSCFDYIQEMPMLGDDLYAHQLYFKGFSKPVKEGKIGIEGDLIPDKNAIYFTNSIETASLYGDYIYSIIPMARIYKYYNSLFCSEIRVAYLLDTSKPIREYYYQKDRTKEKDLEYEFSSCGGEYY